MADEIFSPIGDSIHSIIGEGTRLRGDIEVKGLLRIDGDFSGTIHTNGKVLVSRRGRAECSINGNIVVIGGIVKGTIIAHQSVEILSTGVVLGTIVAPRLIIHENVIFHGICRISSEAERFQEAVRNVEEQTTGPSERSVPVLTPAAMENLARPIAP